MTLHIQIDNQEIEGKLTKLAAQQNKSLEQQASDLLTGAIQYRDEKLQKLRKRLAVGKAQLDRGEYADYSLEKVISELDEEEKQESQVSNGSI